MATVVGDNLREGRDQARTFARATARRHGKHYPRSITVDRTSPLSGEYGPDPSLKQGGMSFEGGSRNQPPHNDLARSADVIGPQFGDDVADLPDRWFW